jgi:hypothetical protein
VEVPRGWKGRRRREKGGEGKVYSKSWLARFRAHPEVEEGKGARVQATEEEGEGRGKGGEREGKGRGKRGEREGKEEEGNLLQVLIGKI